MSQSWASITSSSAGVQLDVAAGVSEKARADAALFRRLDGVGSTLAEHEARVGALDGILCWQKQDDNLLVIFAAYLAASGLSSVAGVIEQASVADAERSAAPSAAAERAAWSTPFFDEMAAAMSKMTLSAAGPTWREIVATGGAEIMLAKRKLTPPQVAETMQAILGNPDVQRLDVSYNAGCFESAAAVAALVELVTSSETLTALDISGTAISPSAAMSLAKALRVNTTLRSVNLINCKNAGPVLRALLAR